jgi:hypothetical protein
MSLRAFAALLAAITLVLAACSTPAATSPSATATPDAEESEPAESTEPTESAEESEPAETDEESPAADADELDYTLASNFGSTDLTAGFSPDPFSVDMVSGGPIDVSYLGEECAGFATAASDYDVTYEAGDQDLLRFYFVADEAVDTTIIVNAPDESWHCNDDAPGTIDPMIDFENPESGRYDIWIGSYDEGAENAGTLYVTELESNSP